MPADGAELDGAELALLRRTGLFDAAWFAERNPDLAGLDALAHFHRFGWREGRWPNAYFDPAWYCGRYLDVRDGGADPLLHYALYGEAEGRRPVEYFDPTWYRARHGLPPGSSCLAHFLVRRRLGAVSPVPEFDAAEYLRLYPDVRAAGMDPFEHYLLRGAAEDRRPSAGFDPLFYRERYLRDLPDANPLLHYLRHRGEPGVHPVRPAAEAGIAAEVRRHAQPGPLFEPVRPLPEEARPRAKVLAFYLPQFHPVPENDAWWGEGFTEWTNVARGLPRFAGHYQPRTPRDLGHYRLEGTATMRRQAELARGAGVHGFVHYFYWFNGRRLLQGPTEAMLADPGVALPFCLMWANENWTRRWDGGEDDVLISQDYRPEDEAPLVDELARHMRDPRYIRVGGRPLLMVYRAGLVRGGAATVARWRRRFRDAHGEDPLLVMAQSFNERDPGPLGMDAAVEFPPHKLTDALPLLNPKLRLLDPAFTGRVYDYAAAARASLDEAPPDYPLIKTAVPGWDNDARKQGAGVVLHGATPAAYQDWMEGLVRRALRHPVGGEALVCVNAWNEWAEGAYLEPDLHFGAAFLNATGRAVAGVSGGAAPGRLLLVGHDAFPAGAQHLLLHLGRQLRRAHGVDVRFLLGGGGGLLPEYEAAAPTVVVAGAAALARAVREAATDGVGAAIVNTCAAADACALLDAAGIAPVLLVHELPRLLRERGLVDAARAGAAASRRVVFACAEVRDRFAEVAAVPPGREVVLPQGLYAPARPDPDARTRLRAELGIPDDAVLALGVGYADLRKGFDLFLQAWRAVRALPGGRGVHLAWVGDIDPTVQAYLGGEVAAAAATGTFHHLPFRPGAAELFAAADVHLLTSREDPFPSVALEAMSAGVPTVAFEGAGGVPDLLRAHGAGQAVPLGDAAAMARALLALARAGGTGRGARLAAVARDRFAFGAYAAELLRLAVPALPRVSVAVLSHQYARYLPDRLRTVFAQTHPVLEVLVLDDASTDGSPEVARAVAEAAGREIVLAVNEANSGSVFRQWRRAAELARGEWLWIAEADDLSQPRFLEAVARAATGVPDAVLAFCDSASVDADGVPVWPSYKPYYADGADGALAEDCAMPAGRFLALHLAERNLILNASAVLWRRSALLAALERCSDLDGYSVAGDWRIYAEALGGGGQVAYVAEPLNTHRRHGASATGRLAPERHLDEISRMHRLLADRLDAGDAGLRDRQRRRRERAAAELAAS